MPDDHQNLNPYKPPDLASPLVLDALDPPIILEGECELEHHRLLDKHLWGPRRRGAMIFVIVLGIALAAGSGAMIIWKPKDATVHYTVVLYGMIIVSLAMIAQFVHACLSADSRLRKSWEQGLLLSGRVRLEITKEYIAHRHGQSEGRASWGSFRGYRSFKDVILLYQNVGVATALFREFCSSDDEWECLKRLVGEKLKKLG